MKLNDRPTKDLIVLMLAGVIGFYLIVSIMWIIAFTFIHPDADVSKTARALASLASTLVGAIIGYVAGKADSNGNGKTNGNGGAK